MAGTTALVLVGLLIARLRLARARKRIALRIHVGGTRGKSSTTRLIADTLRASGIATIAKTTGTEPLLLMPDGTELAWRRFGPASIAEQIRFMRLAQRGDARAVVLECMAVRPELVWASEHLIVNATIAVITNTRADHLEDGGTAPSFIALVPAHGTLVADSAAITEALVKAAAERGSRLVPVDTAGLAPDAANVAIARAVCEIVGIPGGGMPAAATPANRDPGAFFIKSLAVGPKSLRFANAFACNDVESLTLLLETHAHATDTLVMALNHRNDRPLRSLQFLEHIASRPKRPALVIINGSTWLRRAARRRGLAAASVRVGGDAQAGLRALAENVPDNAFVWGVGNFHGAGARLARAAREA